METISKTETEVIKTITTEIVYDIKELSAELLTIEETLAGLNKLPDEILIPNDDKFSSLIILSNRRDEIKALLK